MGTYSVGLEPGPVAASACNSIVLDRGLLCNSSAGAVLVTQGSSRGPAVTSFVKLMHFFQAFHCPKPAVVALPQPMARPFSLKLVCHGHPARYVSTLLAEVLLLCFMKLSPPCTCLSTWHGGICCKPCHGMQCCCNMTALCTSTIAGSLDEKCGSLSVGEPLYDQLPSCSTSVAADCY